MKFHIIIIMLYALSISSCGFFSSGVIAVTKSKTLNWEGTLVKSKSYYYASSIRPIDKLHSNERQVLELYKDFPLMQIDQNQNFIPFTTSIRSRSRVKIKARLDYYDRMQNNGLLMPTPVLVVESIQ